MGIGKHKNNITQYIAMIQLHGLTDRPIVLSSSQIHGNRQLLLTAPEPTLVFAQQKKECFNSPVVHPATKQTQKYKHTIAVLETIA